MIKSATELELACSQVVLAFTFEEQVLDSRLFLRKNNVLLQRDVAAAYHGSFPYLTTAFMPMACAFAGNYLYYQNTSPYLPGPQRSAAPLASSEKGQEWIIANLSSKDALMHLTEDGTQVQLHADALRRAAATSRGTPQ
jgi:hypothetical protein